VDVQHRCGMKDSVKVLIIDDHPLVRDGCQRIFDRRRDIEVAQAGSAQTGLKLNVTFDPDVIVLDIGLPDANGFDIIPKLIGDNAKAKIVVFSMHGAQSFVTNALEKGAVGYITKNDEPNAILAAVDKVKAGEVYLGQTVVQKFAMANQSREATTRADRPRKSR